MFDQKDRKIFTECNPNKLAPKYEDFGSMATHNLIFDSSFKILKEYDFIPAICYYGI
ncbi:MAG: hypothetical protein R2883_00555 [Caldisericia bacterium]